MPATFVARHEKADPRPRGSNHLGQCLLTDFGNHRYEEDLVDQLFNSSEKRLARILLLLARFGKEGVPEVNFPGGTMPPTIQAGTVLINDSPVLTQFFGLEIRISVEPYSRRIDIMPSLIPLLHFDEIQKTGNFGQPIIWHCSECDILFSLERITSKASPRELRKVNGKFLSHGQNAHPDGPFIGLDIPD